MAFLPTRPSACPRCPWGMCTGVLSQRPKAYGSPENDAHSRSGRELLGSLGLDRTQGAGSRVGFDSGVHTTPPHPLPATSKPKGFPVCTSQTDARSMQARQGPRLSASTAEHVPQPGTRPAPWLMSPGPGGRTRKAGQADSRARGTRLARLAASWGLSTRPAARQGEGVGPRATASRPPWPAPARPLSLSLTSESRRTTPAHSGHRHFLQRFHLHGPEMATWWVNSRREESQTNGV